MANKDAAKPEPDTITFNIVTGGQGGAKFLAPATPFDAIKKSNLLIDATTQPGFRGVPLITLDGVNAPASAYGFDVGSASVTIRGFDITHWDTGVVFEGVGAHDCHLQHNFIGIDDQNRAQPNTHGVLIYNNAANNTIGGSDTFQVNSQLQGSRNIISGNRDEGILIKEASENLIYNNYIGTNQDGTAPVGNGTEGVAVTSFDGGPPSQHNKIGYLAVVGQQYSPRYNVISGNGENGIYLQGPRTSLNLVSGNFIGTDRTGENVGAGTSKMGNHDFGVVLLDAASANRIGQGVSTDANGIITEPANVISGNGSAGVLIQDSGTKNNLVQGNFIGLNRNGVQGVGNDGFPMGNLGNGISIRGASSNWIGGSQDPDQMRNVISGNALNGIYIIGADAKGNEIWSNNIGTNKTGDKVKIQSLVNGGNGIFLDAGVTEAKIKNNKIYWNGGDGVKMVGGPNATRANLVADPNSIMGNAELGIDLGGDGVTPDDLGDADSGPNDLQNYPVLTSATVTGSSTTVEGTLNSTASTPFLLEFFGNDVTDPASAQGETFLGTSSVTTDADGNANFQFTFPVVYGHFVTATATDPAGNTSEFSAPVHLDRPPVANDDYFRTSPDTTLQESTPGVLGNDISPSGNPLTAILNTSPASGQTTLNSDGSFVYSPNPGFIGTDSFSYHVTDGVLTSNIATVFVDVTDGTVAHNDNYTILHDQTLTVPAQGVLANDTNPLGPVLVATNFTIPAHGRLVPLPDGSFVYSPNPNYVGTDSFTYKADEKPSARDDVFTLLPNHTLQLDASSGVLANDADGDLDSLTAALVTGPAHGQLTLSPQGAVQYIPDTGFVGTDSFTYQLSDGLTTSNVATVTLDVTPNTGPDDASFSVLHDTTLQVSASGGLLQFDPNAPADGLTASLFQDGRHGSASVNPDGSFTYTPAPGYVGADSFIFEASAAGSDPVFATVHIQVLQPLGPNQNTATVTIQVTDQPPLAVNDSYDATHDQTLHVDGFSGVLANDSDPDNDALSAALVTGPAHGSVTLHADGSFDYTPALHYLGSDSFTYQASDGPAGSNLATVTLNVTNQAPDAQDDWFSVAHDQVLTVNAPGALENSYDPDGDNLSAVLDSAPANGTLDFHSDGSFVYTPNAGYVGSDSFTLHANDGLADSQEATIYLDVVNTPPQASDDAYSTYGGTTLTVNAPGVLGNDSDAEGDTLTATLLSQPAHGTVNFHSDGSFSYTPYSGFSGSDTFTYSASDGLAVSSPANVVITVANPVHAVADSYSMTQNNSLLVGTPGVLANDTDDAGSALSASMVSWPSHGMLMFSSAGSFSYWPSYNYAGSDSFTYQATDSLGNSATATVTLTVNGPVLTPTQTLLAVNPTTSTSGQSVTFTATVQTSSGGSTSATGGVNFYNGSTWLGYAYAYSGSATYTTSSLPVGTDSITAVYSGDSSYQGSTSSAVTETVTQGSNSVPVVTSVTPSSGPTSGGTTVYIYGSGFTGATNVTFGATSAQSWTLLSDSSIQAVSPAAGGAYTVTVAVWYAMGSSAPYSDSSTDQFTYGSTPTLTGISPATGPTSGGTNVILTGTGLSAVWGVKFGNTTTGFTINSDTQILTYSPMAMMSGPVYITLTGAFGTLQTSLVFNYTS